MLIFLLSITEGHFLGSQTLRSGYLVELLKKRKIEMLNTNRSVSLFNNQRKRNFVKENAKVKIGSCVVQKHYASGLYTQHHPSQCNHTLNAQPIHMNKGNTKQVVRIKYQEHVRDLVVPTTMNVHPAIWPVEEIKRIEAKSHMVTIDEKKMELQRKCDEMKFLEEECEKRKAHLKEIDKVKFEEIAEDDTDGAAERQHILDRAAITQVEETEEYKRVNQLFASKKCQLTRAAQVTEKREIQRELRDYNAFVDRTILDDCQKALQLEAENAAKRRQEKAKLAENLKAHVNQKELTEKMAAEKALEMDKAEVNAKAEENARLEEEEKRQRLEHRHRTREDIENFKALRKTLKDKELEEERITELKALEYMRKKQENIKRMAEEKRLVTEEKRRKADELLMLQAKLLETRNQQGESNIKRLEEEKEREYRRRTKEEALRRQQIAKEVQDVRALQLQELRKQKEMEVEKERLALCQLKERINGEELEEQKRLEWLRMQRELNKDEIKFQIKLKEARKQAEEEKAKQEYVREQEKERKRLANIETVINTRLIEMQEAEVPVEDIRDIQRKIKTKLVNP